MPGGLGMGGLGNASFHVVIASDFYIHDRPLPATSARGYSISPYHTSARAHQRVSGNLSPVQAGGMNPSHSLGRRSGTQARFRCSAWEQKRRLCRLGFAVKRSFARKPCSIVSAFPRCRIYRRRPSQQEHRRVFVRRPVVRGNCPGQTDRQLLLKISVQHVSCGCVS